MSDADWKATLSRARSRLNPHQRALYDAVLDRENARNLRVLAAAGSGKTATTVVTLADVINGLNAALAAGVYRPDEILLTTFTRKAAGEMEERLRALLDPRFHAGLFGGALPRVGTFHRILLAWLRQNADRLPQRHRWSMTMNLEVSATDRESERQGVQRAREAAVAQVFGPRVKATQFFKRKAWIYDDILAPEKDAWKFRDLRIAGMPLGIPEWIAENEPELPVPKGADYALATGLLVARGLRPLTRLSEPLVVPSVNDEDVIETYATVREYAEDLGDTLGLPKLFEAWTVYEQIKARLGAWDFDDAMLGFYEHGTLGAALVIVDEAQDNSWVQLACARKIVENYTGSGGKSQILIGDVRQAIYGWRGAAPTVMRDADERAGYTTLTFPTNYRSGSKIVALGNDICYNPSPQSPSVRSGKVVPTKASWAVGPDTTAGRREDPARRRMLTVGKLQIPTYPADLVTDGPKTEIPEGTIRILPASDSPLDEARTIGADISALIYAGVSYAETVILCRTNALGVLMEIGCLLQKLPVLRVSRSGRPFFEEGDIQEVLAYLRAGIRDESKGFFDIANSPKRGIYTSKLRDRLRGQTLGAREVIRLIEAESLSSRDYADELPLFRERLDLIREAPWSEAPKLAIQTILPQYGKTTPDEEDDDAPVGAPSTEEDTANYDAFVEIAAMFESLPELERFIARLATEAKSIPESVLADMTPAQRVAFDEDRKRRVLICTVHAAKGLEFGHVYIPCSMGTFPSMRSTTPARMAEERRLFYVAVTRAIDGVAFSYSWKTATGKDAGPSEFLETWVEPAIAPKDPTDIPPEGLEPTEPGEPEEVPRTPGIPAEPDGSLGDLWRDFEAAIYKPARAPLNWTLASTPTDFEREGVIVYTLPDGTSRSIVAVDPSQPLEPIWSIRMGEKSGSTFSLGSGLELDEALELIITRQPFPDPAWKDTLSAYLRRYPNRTVTFAGRTLTWGEVARGLYPETVPARKTPPVLPSEPPTEPVPDAAPTPVTPTVAPSAWTPTDTPFTRAERDLGTPEATERLVAAPLRIGDARVSLGILTESGRKTVFIRKLLHPVFQEGTRIQVYSGPQDAPIYRVTGEWLAPIDAQDLGRYRDPFESIPDLGLRRLVRTLWYATSGGSFVIRPRGISSDTGTLVSFDLTSPNLDVANVAGDPTAATQWFMERDRLRPGGKPGEYVWVDPMSD